MACGDKYESLAVTPSGYTLDAPGTILPGSFLGQPVYREWYELARELSAKAHQKFVELGEIDPTYKSWNALVESNNEMTEAYEELTAPALVVLSYSDARDEAMAVVRKALCLLERAQASIDDIRDPPRFKFKVPRYAWIIGGVLVVGGLATTAGVLVHRRNKNKRKSNPSAGFNRIAA